MYKKITLLISILLSFISFKTLAEPFTLQSSDFTNNGVMPLQLTCYGKNISPALSWQGAPEKTQSFVLIMNDPDAPNQPWVHWLVFNIPATATALPSGSALPNGALSGINSKDVSGYSGPCPPKGLHHYIFTLYALKKPLTVNSSVHYEDILNAMQGLIIKKARIIGLYQK